VCSFPLFFFSDFARALGGRNDSAVRQFPPLRFSWILTFLFLHFMSTSACSSYSRPSRSVKSDAQDSFRFNFFSLAFVARFFCLLLSFHFISFLKFGLPDFSRPLVQKSAILDFADPVSSPRSGFFSFCSSPLGVETQCLLSFP